MLFMRRRLSHYTCGVLQCDVEVLWEYFHVCTYFLEIQLVGRKLRHYLSGCVCLFCGYLQYYIQRSTKKTDLHVLTLPQPDMLMESPSADLLPDSR